jgi:glycosyltransferase involved in cell wall biosynthesis
MIKASVAMVTYQHERFIAQAIESVLQQRTTFDFELIIGEDCSSDQTRDIARDYAARFPARVRLELPEKNVGLTRNLSRTIDLCRGQYVAWLEGDDYWTSPDKLQRQADYLDANLDCAWCFTRAIVVDEGGQPIQTPPAVRVVQSKYTLAEYLDRLFQPRACTVMFRHRLFSEFPDWFYDLPTGDMPIHVLNAQHGNIGFIDETMAAYRIHPGGVWSMGVSPGDWGGESCEQLSRRAARYAAVIRIYETIDRHLQGEHRVVIRRQVSGFARALADVQASLGDHTAMRRSLWKALRAEPRSGLALLRRIAVSRLSQRGKN